MNRSTYFNYIDEKLEFISYRIKNRGKINLLDLNIYSETFFAELINKILKYNLKNINPIKQNTEGIDLIDEENRIIAQVSSTCTKQKIEKSLKKEILKKYTGYRFKFIAISGEAYKLRNNSFENPYNSIFDPAEDIYDIKSLLSHILNMPIKELYDLYLFIKAELGNDIDIVKIDTNLASIINILSKEDLSGINISPEINTYEIDRKVEFNNLVTARLTIDDYKVFYSKLNEKYKEFDRLGANKSKSVFSAIRNQYIKLLSKDMSSDELFLTIIDNVIKIIINSKNYVEIPYEELEMCVSILVVDSFIRCKIFKNPEGYSHVIT